MPGCNLEEKGRPFCFRPLSLLQPTLTKGSSQIRLRRKHAMSAPAAIALVTGFNWTAVPHALAEFSPYPVAAVRWPC